ncbi:hypothetical protein XELAEV_18036822mg [Xenopus laevis]|uniref:Uncharacterized protein n=1 Tax=Xenopus laevis TaxID=8355 RepID=A0A974CBH0_XENLA|nr:hypothetical protein XELAEV_18036822mg [Xenopus laevis]
MMVMTFSLGYVSFTHTESCFSCPDFENLPAEQKELLPLTDKLEKAVSAMLDDPKELEKLKGYSEYIQKQICSQNLKSMIIPIIKTTSVDLLDRIAAGNITKEDIVEYLQVNPEELFKLFETDDSNTEDDYNDENTEKEE